MSEPCSKGELRLCRQLALEGDSAASFLAALKSGKHSRSALVLSPRAAADYQPPFPCINTEADPNWAWLPPRVFIPEIAGCKPASYDDYREGKYYLLDLSSCWESAPLSCVPTPSRSLDLCAAPGGKTMLMHGRYAASEKHVANEVHAARRGILRQNVELCGLPRLEVTGLRPDQWASSGELFDLILADAPCSGQSLLAKGIKNTGCLGASMVNGNAKRQKGILLAALSCLAPGGHLLYSTCTYTTEENEKVMAYLLKRHPHLQAVEIELLEPFRSTLCSFPAYRLLPAHGFGAGGFCCLLQRN